MPDQPLVSVVTPVYNGATYLAECIESVLAQDYPNFEYVISDNHSTDETLAIARRYAEQDPRVRVHCGEEFLPIIANWNRALRQLSAQSKYCKTVHADDVLLPGCIRLMVELAEQNPNVAIVGAYRINGSTVDLDWLSYPQAVFPGHDVCRQRLAGAPDIFGSPTSTLLRSDLVRARHDFYDVDNLHSDTDVCFEILLENDFGFVHQVLTYTRRHNEAYTGWARLMQTQKVAQFKRLVAFGPQLFDTAEYGQRYRQMRKQYLRVLGFSFLLTLFSTEFRAQRRRFWDYHRNALASFGQQLRFSEVALAALGVIYNKVLSVLMIK